MSVVLTVADGKKVLASGSITFRQEANIYLAEGGFRFRRSPDYRRTMDGNVFMIEIDLPFGEVAAGTASFDIGQSKYDLLYTLRQNSVEDPLTMTADYTLMDRP